MSFHFWFMKEYIGRMTLQSKYFLSMHFGRDPTTSARPPVLTNGITSDATKSMFFIFFPTSLVVNVTVNYLNYKTLL